MAGASGPACRGQRRCGGELTAKVGAFDGVVVALGGQQEVLEFEVAVHHSKLKQRAQRKNIRRRWASTMVKILTNRRIYERLGPAGGKIELI